MANLGNVGKAVPWFAATVRSLTTAHEPMTSGSTISGIVNSSANTLENSASASNVIEITGATVGSMVTLYERQTPIADARADGTGSAFFYSLPDTIEYLYYAHEANSNNLWSISVSGLTIVVTPISSGGGVQAFAWAG